MPSPHRAARWATTDGMGLVILGLSCIGRGVSYFPFARGESAGRAHYAEAWLDMTVWAIIWVVVGIFAIAVSGRWSSPAAATATGLTVGLHALWASSLLLSTFSGDMSRGYVSAISYLAIVALSLWAFGRGRRDDRTVVVPRE